MHVAFKKQHTTYKGLSDGVRMEVVDEYPEKVATCRGRHHLSDPFAYGSLELIHGQTSPAGFDPRADRGSQIGTPSSPVGGGALPTQTEAQTR